MKTTWYYVSTQHFTGAVLTDASGYIQVVPEEIKHFNTLHISSLQNWITRHRLHIFEEREGEVVSLEGTNESSYETS